jgi:TetR/AcrR family fatty acid metabolism transcriptional regulator
VKSRQGDKYQKILAAALKVFARKGFYQSKVSEIAKLANVADGTIYLYFKNKDDILISLFEEEMQRAIDDLETALAGQTDPRRKLQIVALTHLSLVDSRREVAEILQVEVRQSFKFMKEYRNEKFIQYLNIIAAIVAEGQERGFFRTDVHPDVVKRAFFGALDEMSLYWVLSTKRAYSIETAAEQISRCFLSGLLAQPGD